MADENKNVPTPPAQSVAAKLLSLLDLKVGDFEKAVRGADPALSVDQLVFLRIGEENGQNRKGILDAIDAAQERLAKAGELAAAEAERKALAEADAKLLRFALGEKLPEGADAAAAAKTGATFLVLGDGTREIAGLNRVAAQPGDWAPGGGVALYTRPVLIDSVGLEKQFLHAVALIDDEGAIHGICEIPGGVHLGGKIELPANSLIFG